MDTPKSRPKTDFKKVERGYDPTEVDALVTSLRKELADAKGRPRAAAATAGGPSTDRLHDPDRAVERMLAAAHQTADRVVYEAEAEAERVLAEADAEALGRVNKADETARKQLADTEEKTSRQLADADAKGERIRKDAVAEARRVVEDTRKPLAREVRSLRDTRDALRSEIDSLRALLSTHRERVRTASDELRTLADDPDVFRIADPGPATEVTVNLDDDYEIVATSPPQTAETVDEIDLRESDAKPVAAAATARADAPAKAKGKPAPAAKAAPAKPASGPNAKADGPVAKGGAKGPAAAKKAAPAKGAAAAAPAAKAPKPASAPIPTPPKQAAAPESGSVFSAAIDADEIDDPNVTTGNIVTLDNLGKNSEPTWSAQAPEPNPGGGRVISGAFAEQLGAESDGDQLSTLGSAPGDGGFLNEVRRAAETETTGGLPAVEADEGEAITKFFEENVEKKRRFGRRNRD